MSDTVVVMDRGRIQQIGTPEGIYNEPKNAFVADLHRREQHPRRHMRADYVVEFFGRKFRCLDKGFAPNEPVDVVIRPEDVDIVPADSGHLSGSVTSVTFKGVHYDTIVDFKGFKWLIQTTDYHAPGEYIGHQAHAGRHTRHEEERILRHVRRLQLLQRRVRRDKRPGRGHRRGGDPEEALNEE